MKLKHFMAAVAAALAVPAAHSYAVLGAVTGTAVPLVEGGLLAVGAAALVAGVRVVRGKQKR